MTLAPFVLLLAALPGEAFRDISYDGALAAAKKEGKLVLVDFQNATSPESQKLEKVTLMDSRVRAFLAERVVAIHADPEREVVLARKFHVESTPVVLFVDAQGAEVDRYVGFVEPVAFLLQARGTLEGKDALFRARASVAAKPKDPRLHLDLARILHDKGREDEALAELLWCFDHGVESDPGFAETRVATVLPEIHRLGQAYPDALDKLAQRSDEAAGRILAGKARPGDVDDVLRIDERMSRVDHTLELYDALAEKPELAETRRRLAPDVYVVLLADRRYVDALECLGDPVALLEKRIGDCAQAEKPGTPENAKGPQAVALTRRDAIETGCRAYETLLGANKLDLAKPLLDRILEFDGRVGTYQALMDHAARAGFPKIAIEIAHRGMTGKLSPGDVLKLKAAVSALNAPK